MFPNHNDLSQLPAGAAIAFGVRCARRSLQLYASWDKVNSQHVSIMEAAIKEAESIGRNARLTDMEQALLTAADAPKEFASEDVNARPVVDAAQAVLHGIGLLGFGHYSPSSPGLTDAFVEPAFAARLLVQACRKKFGPESATTTAAIAAIWSDFEHLKERVENEPWPLAPPIFPALWLDGTPVGWP